MSPRSQAASIPRERSVAATEAMRSAAPPMSPARSRHTVRDPDTTPTPSRAGTPDHLGLNAEEQRLVQSVLGADPMTRTSFALSTMAPSMLEPEMQHSHFHDLELCQLLHALDQPMGEPVKKAVRKAVRARVKKLGMKYDNEVCFLTFRCRHSLTRAFTVYSAIPEVISRSQPCRASHRRCRVQGLSRRICAERARVGEGSSRERHAPRREGGPGRQQGR